MNKKSLIASVLIAIAVVGVVGYLAYAVLSWHGSITWTVESRQFSVWSLETEGVPLESPYLSPQQGLLTPGQYSFGFWLENNGNVPVVITVSGETGLGAVAKWDGPWTIQAGTTRILATLTLTITATGSYSWDFVGA